MSLVGGVNPGSGDVPLPWVCIWVQGDAVSLRDPKETIKSLRLILERLEQNADPAEDAVAKGELKRILLRRIAELEVVTIPEPGNRKAA